MGLWFLPFLSNFGELTTSADRTLIIRPLPREALISVSISMCRFHVELSSGQRQKFTGHFYSTSDVLFFENGHPSRVVLHKVLNGSTYFGKLTLLLGVSPTRAFARWASKSLESTSVVFPESSQESHIGFPVERQHITARPPGNEEPIPCP